MKYELRIAGKFYDQLKKHLFHEDGKESIAIILCGRHNTSELSILLSHQVILIPNEECERTHDSIKWKTTRVIPLLEEVEKRNFAILKIHSHPGGYDKFSELDDVSDKEFFSTVFSWSETDQIHGSAIMLPDGRILGRAISKNLEMDFFNKISIVDEQIQIWNHENKLVKTDNGYSLRNQQMLGEKTYSLLTILKIGIVGCSGTGSPTIEQLFRLGVGELVLVDPDKIEKKNLNRIIQATMQDAIKGEFKVKVLHDAIKSVGLDTEVKYIPANLFE